MRAVLQRVKTASVEVNEAIVGKIEAGLLVFLGVGAGDGDTDLAYVVAKIAELRIFGDEAGKMNLCVGDVGGSVLLVSQFTLYADIRRGRRPSFTDAMPPAEAAAVVERAAALIRQRGIRVETGVFGADMKVSLVNDGPVTIIVDSRQTS